LGGLCGRHIEDVLLRWLVIVTIDINDAVTVIVNHVVTGLFRVGYDPSLTRTPATLYITFLLTQLAESYPCLFGRTVIALPDLSRVALLSACALVHNTIAVVINTISTNLLNRIDPPVAPSQEELSSLIACAGTVGTGSNSPGYRRTPVTTVFPLAGARQPVVHRTVAVVIESVADLFFRFALRKRQRICHTVVSNTVIGRVVVCCVVGAYRTIILGFWLHIRRTRISSWLLYTGTDQHQHQHKRTVIQRIFIG